MIWTLCSTPTSMIAGNSWNMAIGWSMRWSRWWERPWPTSARRRWPSATARRPLPPTAGSRRTRALCSAPTPRGRSITTCRSCWSPAPTASRGPSCSATPATTRPSDQTIIRSTAITPVLRRSNSRRRCPGPLRCFLQGAAEIRTRNRASGMSWRRGTAKRWPTKCGGCWPASSSRCLRPSAPATRT